MQLEVDALQAEAGSARQAAEAGQAAVLEVDRLAQDNALLAARLSQMDVDLQASLLQQSVLPLLTGVSTHLSYAADSHVVADFMQAWPSPTS